MEKCAKIFEWKDRYKVPLDKLLRQSFACKSRLLYRLDYGDNIVRVVVGAKSYDDALNTALDYDIENDYQEFFDPETQQFPEPYISIRGDITDRLDKLKQYLKVWEFPYNHSSSGYDKHRCPKCGHIFKEK